MAQSKNAWHQRSDEEIMQAIHARDAAAFEALYDRYAKLLLNYFHRMLWKDKEKARDFVQELFTKIIHKPELFDASRPFKTWVYSVAHNMCKNEYAKHEVRTAAARTLRAESASHTHGDGAASSMDRSAFNRDLRSALNELDDVKRTTFELRFYQELSITEISEVMQCSEGTVKSRLFYTLKELNSQLKVYEGILGALWLILSNII
jgi:RNA polymerase sigma factor (sigma-70 family)